MSPTMDFRTSAEGGNVPGTADGTAILMGKPANLMDLAKNLYQALAGGKAVPVNWMAATVNVAPGGRDPDEIDPDLLKNKTAYKPQDMFGLGN